MKLILKSPYFISFELNVNIGQKYFAQGIIAKCEKYGIRLIDDCNHLQCWTNGSNYSQYVVQRLKKADHSTYQQPLPFLYEWCTLT